MEGVSSFWWIVGFFIFCIWDTIQIHLECSGFQIFQLEQELGIPVFRMESERRVLFIQDGLDKSEQLHLVAKGVHRQFLA